MGYVTKSCYVRFVVLKGSSQRASNCWKRIFTGHFVVRWDEVTGGVTDVIDREAPVALIGVRASNYLLQCVAKHHLCCR